MKISKSIILDALTEKDASTMFTWVNDRKQVIFNTYYKPVHEGQHLEWFESIQKRKDIKFFGIRLRETRELIGSCQLHSINLIHRSAELQIRIGKVSERGQGYGTKATKLLLNYAFKDLNLHRVHLHVLCRNINAIHMYEKVGFVHEGVLRKAAHIDGCYTDLIIMGLLREEYEDN